MTLSTPHETDVQDRVHDLRNLFSVVASSVHLLQDRAASDQEALLLHAIDRAAHEGGEIAGEMLGREHPASRRRLDLNTIVADLEPVLAGMLGAQVDFTLDLCPDPLPMGIDPRGIENALLELVLNARRALTGRGIVTIRSRRIGTRAWLIVADNGRGVARPDWPIDRHANGRPGGLARIDRWLRTVHGRRHWRSTPGSGTITALDLPLRMTVPATAPLRQISESCHARAVAA
ncbi:MAG: ATP-binding protein [Sphingomonas sp.]